MCAIKDLLTDNDDLKAIKQHVTATRAMHTNMTMPWSNSGLRLLPTAQFFKYNQAMTEMQNEFHRLVQNFLDKYNDAVIDVQIKLGDLFSRDDYPTLDELTHKFRMGISYTDVPTGDFRVALPAEAIAELRTQKKLRAMIVIRSRVVVVRIYCGCVVTPVTEQVVATLITASDSVTVSADLLDVLPLTRTITDRPHVAARTVSLFFDRFRIFVVVHYQMDKSHSTSTTGTVRRRWTQKRNAN